MQLSKEVKRKVRGYNGWGVVGGGGGVVRAVERGRQGKVVRGGVHKEEGRRGEGREKALFILDS